MTQRELGLVLLSAVLHAAWNVAAKRNAQPAAFLLLLIGLTGLVTLALLPLVPAVVWSSSIVLWLAFSSALHGLSFIALARAYERADLSIVYPISRSTPALVPLLAVPWLGERLSLAGVFGIALTLIGMWLVQTGGALRRAALFDRSSVWAYVLLLITTGFSITDKRLMGLLSAMPWDSPLPRAVVGYLLPTVGAALIVTPYALKFIGPRTLASVMKARGGWIVGAAVATFVSYALTLEALRTAQVSYVVAVRQCSVLFAVCLAVWALREKPTLGRWLGALGTVAGVALIALYA
jgi:drug/metabolite transporter (DMT)-like permease